MIRKLFVGSLVALAGGLVLLVVAEGLAYASSGFVKDGPDVVGITQFIAWVGAVLNTAPLEDQTWFIVLLVTGLLSSGFIAMIVYLVAGPDDPLSVQTGPALAEAPTQNLLSRSA